MNTIVEIPDINEMFEKVEREEKGKRDELINFTKCVAHNPDRFKALCSLRAIDASKIDKCCKPISEALIKDILADAYELLLSGEMKVNGKVNNWNNGGFGSRWFDMDAETYGVQYIRAAFYSKKYYSKEWKEQKPYAIELMIEN